MVGRLPFSLLGANVCMPAQYAFSSLAVARKHEDVFPPPPPTQRAFGMIRSLALPLTASFNMKHRFVFSRVQGLASPRAEHGPEGALECGIFLVGTADTCINVIQRR